MKLSNAMFIAGTTLICIECRNDPVEDDGFCKDYSAGKISVGVASILTTSQAFELIDDNGGEILNMSGSLYISDLPGDSLDYVMAYLNTKSYIKSNGFSAGAYLNFYTGALTVPGEMWSMTKTNQEDWNTTSQLLKLNEQPNVKVFLLSVPAGLEKKFVNTYKTVRNVQFAELDCWLNLTPL